MSNFEPVRYNMQKNEPNDEKQTNLNGHLMVRFSFFTPRINILHILIRENFNRKQL